MKTFTGRALPLVLLLLSLLGTGIAQAAVTASLDRQRVALGDSLRLTITADGEEELSAVDLAPLQRDFEILRRSTSSQTRFVNGQRSHTRQLLLDLAPRVEGQLQIPPLRVGDTLTPALAVAVAAPPTMDSQDNPVVFEAEVDRDSVYVQGQVILTLRVLQAINLEGRSVSELELDNAFVKPLEQNSFQRSIDGRQWLVHELRYAIFPEQSGTLEIPPQAFSGRQASGRRSLFDLGSGRRLRRTTRPLSIEVLPRPADYPDGTWLPARKLTLEEHWSTPPEQLRVGESATRTIRITGEGLQGAQLPPVLFQPVQGVKFYPDQPEIGESEVASGLLGTRRDSAALVPLREGELALPEIRIPWWDTENETLRYAVLPARRLHIAPGDIAPATALPPAAAPATPGEQVAAGAAGASALPWQLLSVASSLGWLLTLAYLLYSRRRGLPAISPAPAGGADAEERRLYRQLRDACNNGDAAAARRAAPAWARALSGDDSIVALQQVAALFDDTALTAQLEALDRSLYARENHDWSGAVMASRLDALRDARRRRDEKTPDELRLYPQPGAGV